MTEWAVADGIRSVINLRGRHEGSPWYDDEVAWPIDQSWESLEGWLCYTS